MEALGKHIIVDYFNCDKAKLDDLTFIEECMCEAAKLAGATIINSTSHRFSPWGVSCVVVIQESHLSVHTWPEYKFASVDLFTCGDTVDPWVAFNFLQKSFGSSSHSVVELKRGLKQFLSISISDVQTGENDSPPPQFSSNIWFQDINKSVGAGQIIKTVKRLYKETSEFQKIEIYETEKWGNMLVLDDTINLTEKDEFVYHEMISHVALLSHPKPKRVLIIGGGDGGTVREVLKHTQLEKVVMVEIDKKVIDASKRYLPNLACKLDDPKLDLKVDDGIKYMMNAKDKSFDVIVVDSTDPEGFGDGLFTEEFYENCKRVMDDDGVLVCQAPSFTGSPQQFEEVYGRYYKIFGNEKVWSYMYNTPTYATGGWTFSYCAKGESHPYENLNMERVKKFLKKNEMKYYNEEIHRAAFVFPNFARKMLGKLARVCR